MSKKSEDRRFRRTRLLLRRALLELIVERRYERITVRDIINRADVGRSTFYSHFRDKDDLLLTGFEPAFEVVSGLVHVDESGELRIAPTEKYFQHAKENHYVFQALARGRVIDKILERVQHYWAKSFEDELKDRRHESREPEIPLTVLSNYVANTFLTLLKWWLEHDMPYPPEHMDLMFRRLVAPTVEAAIGPEKRVQTRNRN